MSQNAPCSKPLNLIIVTLLSTIDLYISITLRSKNGLKFSIYEHDKFLFDIETKLKGVHNVDNILLAYAVKRILDKEGFIISDSLFKESKFKFEFNVE